MLFEAPTVKVALAFGALAVFGLFARQIYNAGYNAAVLKEKERTGIVEQAAKEFDRKLAQRIGAIRIQHVTLRQEVQKEIRENVVYRDCVSSDRVFQLTNAAITGSAVPPGTVELRSSGPPD